MAISRVIEASFGRSNMALVRVNTAYFYNNGIIFKPTDLDLPASYQVHWADSPQATSTLETIGTSEGALIPDDLWNRSRVIYGWIYLHPTNDSSVTGYEVRIYKNVRAGLPDGTEPTPAEQSTIDQLISALNEAVEQTGEDVESASQSARSANDDADRAEGARTGAETAQGKAEEAQESAERAKDDAETSERNASESERKAKGYAETASEKSDSIHSMTASAQTLPAGSSASASYNAETGVMSFGIPKGKDGTDGDDGYSPTANVSKSGKVATITITDKNGTTSAQVSDGEDGTDGIDGISPSVSVTNITNGHRVVITDKDGEKSFDVEDGATGATPNLTIGTVETLEPTDDATATITGTAENPVLNLGIPRGESGEVTLADLNSALIEKAPIITDTASGSIASFSDGADDLPLKSLIVDINPIQDLSQGDPSPENICPISGWTEVDVEQSGVNVWDEEWEVGDILASTGENAAANTVIRTKNYIPVKPNTQYFAYINASGSASLRSRFYGINKDFIGTTPKDKPAVVYNQTFTTPDNCYYMRFTPQTVYGTTYNHDISINYPSSDHSYHPYTGRSITINLGQTVYGGHLDVVSGVLTVDRANIASYNGETLPSTWISDRDVYASGTTPTTGAQVVYRLATPLEIQLDAHAVSSLHGVNNIWADSGDTEVEYRADTKLFIERLTVPDSADMIADANITSGQYFMVGNSLYKATANIANGSSIIVGTNAVRKSLSEALNEINA